MKKFIALLVLTKRNALCWLFSIGWGILTVMLVAPAPAAYLLTLPLQEQWLPALGVLLISALVRLAVECAFPGETNEVPESGE